MLFIICYVLYFKQINMKKIKYIEPNNSIFGKFFRFFFGIELNTKFKEGTFHQKGYSGKQKNDSHDIIIVEKNDGIIITIPNKEKYYKFIN